MSTLSIQSATTSPFQTILDWSTGWPKWQADAVRRIILQGDLKASDLDELENICKAQHGLATATATPVSRADIPVGPDASSSVSLICLSGLKNVNRIRDGATMEFGPAPGLTIAFGDNGTGKSSYARVIKRACRARGTSSHIKPNVFDPKATSPAMAQIICAVGTVETPLNWRDGAPSDPRLSNIFVFDAVSARLHVTEDGPATFIPRGLDVLPKLAKACDELKGRFKRASESASAGINQTRLKWKCRETTKVGKFVLGVTEHSSTEVIEAMATFPDAQRKRLTELTDALRADSKKKSQTTIASAARVDAFADLVVQRATLLNQKQVTEIAEVIRRSIGAEQAATAAVGPRFDDGYLAGTGGEAWRELWEIARRFSTTTAYPNKAFPVADARSQCLLCQQTLDAASKQRLVDFEDYVRSQSRIRADEARSTVATTAETFGAVEKLMPEYSRIAADLLGEPTNVLQKIESFVVSADSLGEHIEQALRRGNWTDHPGLSESPADDLRRVAETLKQRTQMELSAHDPEKRMLVERERDELEDHEWLSKAKAEVISVVKQKQFIAQIKNCQDDTITNAITIKSGELHDAYVTKAFCDRFKAELAALGLRTLPVKLESVKGTKGERKFGIRLDVPTGVAIADVASEGEQRCMALAVFLAELSQASHRSALVFDDPVCSLDHANRQTVAKRLCDEGRIRQVIVFTHDPVFLGELLEITEKDKISCEKVFLSWQGGLPGKCEKGLPHDWQKYTERLDALEKNAAEMKRDWNPVPNPQNVAAMRDSYGRFRATVEKVVQDVIFNGVVVRYRSYINVSPQTLGPVVGFNQLECDVLLRLHKTACDCIVAHDPAAGKHAPVPTPSEFKKDIDDLKHLIQTIKERRKTAVAVRNL